MILLVRHGSTKLNHENKLRGWLDVPLSDKGIEEAREVGNKLRDDTNHYDGILSSDLIRTKETSNEISKLTGAPIISYHKELRPWDVGNLAGESVDETLPILQDYAKYKPDEAPKGGESFNDFKKRYLSFIKDTLEEYDSKKIIVVAHHRNDVLLKAWEKLGMPGDLNIDEETMLTKGISPADYREINAEQPIQPKNKRKLKDFVEQLKGGKTKRLKDLLGDLPVSEIAEKPEHIWNGTKIRFENSEGEWGNEVDLKGEKGNKGEKGEKGDDGYIPIKGIDYFDGRDGKDGKDGVGKDGKDGRDGKDGKDASDLNPEDIIEKLKGLKGDKRLPLGAIAGSEFLKKLDMNDQRWHGGGLSKVTTDASLTGDGTPSNPLKSAGSGSGDVTGPATNTADYVPQWNGTDSKNLKNGLQASSVNTGGALVLRDASGNSAFNNIVVTTTSTVSSGVTLSLSYGSGKVQHITGSSTQKITLPDCTYLYSGEQFEIDNDSTGLVSVYKNDGITLVGTVPLGGYAIFVCTDNSTTNGIWSLYYYLPDNISWGDLGLTWMYDGDQQVMGNADASKFYIGGVAANVGTLAGLLGGGDFAHYYFAHNFSQKSSGVISSPTDPTSSSYVALFSDKGKFNTYQAPAGASVVLSSIPTFSLDMVTGQLGLGTPSFLDSSNLFNISSASTASLQANIQNSSNGNSASSDLIATADTGNNTTNYVDVGINSSTYNDIGYTITEALCSYLLANGGNLTIGTATAAKIIRFHTGGTLLANLRMSISDTAVTISNKLAVPNTQFISGEKFSRTFTITNPTGAKYFKGWRCPVEATITAVHLNCSGNVVVGQLWQFDSNGLNGSAVDNFDLTGIVDTNVNDNGPLSSPSITAGNYVGWHTTSVTGSPTYAYISFEGYYN